MILQVCSHFFDAWLFLVCRLQFHSSFSLLNPFFFIPSSVFLYKCLSPLVRWSIGRWIYQSVTHLFWFFICSTDYAIVLFQCFTVNLSFNHLSLIFPIQSPFFNCFNLEISDTSSPARGLSFAHFYFALFSLFSLFSVLFRETARKFYQFFY